LVHAGINVKDDSSASPPPRPSRGRSAITPLVALGTHLGQDVVPTPQHGGGAEGVGDRPVCPEVIKRIGLDDIVANLSAAERRELKRRLQS
jgi:hypothetical protein